MIRDVLSPSERAHVRQLAAEIEPERKKHREGVNLGGRPRRKDGKPWILAGVSRATFYRRQKWLDDQTSEKPAEAGRQACRATTPANMLADAAQRPALAILEGFEPEEVPVSADATQAS